MTATAEFSVTVRWVSDSTRAKRRTRVRVVASDEAEARRVASYKVVGHEHARTERVVRHRKAVLG